jgi:hypothetical protein
MMCLQYSHFSTGDVEFEKFDAKELRCYEMFVLYTLMMDERIFALFPNDAGWLFSIKDDIRMHRKFLTSPIFSAHLAGQEWSILPLIKQVVAENQAPDLEHSDPPKQ